MEWKKIAPTNIKMCYISYVFLDIDNNFVVIKLLIWQVGLKRGVGGSGLKISKT